MDVTLKVIGAEWCAPCKRVWPWVREIADQLTGLGDVACSYVSIEDYKGDDVLSVPTLIVLRDGQEVGRVTRFSGRVSLAGWIRRMLEAPPVIAGGTPSGEGGYPVREETPPCR